MEEEDYFRAMEINELRREITEQKQMLSQVSHENVKIKRFVVDYDAMKMEIVDGIRSLHEKNSKQAKINEQNRRVALEKRRVCKTMKEKMDEKKKQTEKFLKGLAVLAGDCKV